MSGSDSGERAQTRRDRVAALRTELREHTAQVRAERSAHTERIRALRAERRMPDVADQPGTRERIQEVALELFTENGYEATSLREIAERLGVTKAALYYHFKTKDDIIASLADDRLAKIEELLAWARSQARTLETRREFVRRYAATLDNGGHQALMRFFERNQTAMHNHKSVTSVRERMRDILDVLSDPGSPLADQLRCSLAIFALHATWFVIRDPHITDEQRRIASLEVALDLVEVPDHPAQREQ
jgi:AcrR family transcriptional regulator